MLKKSKISFAVLISLSILSGCQNPIIPAGYLPKTKDVSSEAFGKWIKLTTYSDSIKTLSVELSGELIAVETDSVYILTEVDLITLHRDRISGASVYLFQSRKEPVYGFLGLIPTFAGIIATGEYAGGFFVLGFPLLVTSVIQTVIRGNEILYYPKKATLNDLVKFSRYPQGMPPDINRDLLHLKI